MDKTPSATTAHNGEEVEGARSMEVEQQQQHVETSVRGQMLLNPVGEEHALTSSDDGDSRQRVKVCKCKDVPVIVMGEVGPDCEDLVRNKKWDELEKLTPLPEVEGSCDIEFSAQGEQVEVLKPITTRVLLVLTKEDKLSFKFLPVQSIQYTIKFQPSESTLLYNESRAVLVDVTLTMMCTTTAAIEIPVVFQKVQPEDTDEAVTSQVPHGDQAFQCMLKSHVQSLPSRFLDPYDLSYECVETRLWNDGEWTSICFGQYRDMYVTYKTYYLSQEKSLELVNRQASLLQEFRHPCIVNCIGCVTDPGSSALVTEDCKFGSLPYVMKDNPAIWTTRMKVKALYNCACAMNFLHQHLIIHRNIRPESLIVMSLDPHSSVICKLTEFDFAERLSALPKDNHLTQMMGNPLFMAPEMHRGFEYSNKVDVYSFGITAAVVMNNCKWKLLVPNRLDFDDDYSQAVVCGMRPTIEKGKKMPLRLKTLIESCWDDNPDKRPSFDWIEESLEKLLVGL